MRYPGQIENTRAQDDTNLNKKYLLNRPSQKPYLNKTKTKRRISKMKSIKGMKKNRVKGFSDVHFMGHCTQ
jgi:hypothetical protein